MNDMKDFGDHQQCPSVDGIVFATGEIQQINVDVDWGPPVSYRLKLGTKTSINELENNQLLYWSDCAILASMIYEERQIEVVAGESDHGSDGFVAVMSNKSKNLKWLAFFTCSNPFSRLEIDNNQILATSTLGITWVFPVNKPEAVIVKAV
ncbi:MAG: hypothetical protein ACYTBZ_22640 [Planctomycetota bacterium]|jgi:hypothetical protein